MPSMMLLYKIELIFHLSLFFHAETMTNNIFGAKNICIVCVLSGLKTTSAEAQKTVTTTATTQKQEMRKSCLPAGIELAAFGLPVH